MATFDEHGNPAPDEPATPDDVRKKRARLDGLGGPGSIGASIWEILHPAQVQEEYRALGQEPPAKIDIITGGISDVADTAATDIRNAADTATGALTSLRDVAPLLLVVAVVWMITSHMPKDR